MPYADMSYPQGAGRESSVCSGGGGGRGGGNLGVMGREVYGRQEKRGQKAGYLKGARAGRNGKNFTTLTRYFVIGKVRRGELLWKGAGTGSAGCGRQDVQTTLPPPPTLHCSITATSKDSLP